MPLPPTVEWCSTCTSTRLVRLLLEDVKEETKVVEVEKASCCEATALDACTQTPQRRRRGGRGSRVRRLLAFQLMLTKKKGLPLSRLLTIKETNSRCSNREEQMRLQEESASPLLNRKSVKVVKEEVSVGEKEDMKEEKEEEVGPGKKLYLAVPNILR